MLILSQSENHLWWVLTDCVRCGLVVQKQENSSLVFCGFLSGIGHFLIPWKSKSIRYCVTSRPRVLKWFYLIRIDSVATPLPDNDFPFYTAFLLMKPCQEWGWWVVIVLSTSPSPASDSIQVMPLSWTYYFHLQALWKRQQLT